MAFGKIYIAGSGPGDAGLITVRAMEAISEADCIVYDLLVNVPLLAYANPSAEIVFVGSPDGRETIRQDKIHSLLLRKAKQHKKIVRLKGGDPFVFGHGSTEAEFLADKGVPFEVIPGVTSAAAVPAASGIPLTDVELSSSVAIVSGHRDALAKRDAKYWKSLSVACSTLVFLMGRRSLDIIAKGLIKGGRKPSSKAALIVSGTMSSQKTFEGRLDEIAELARRERIESPVIFVSGPVVGLRERLNWFETRPLFGKKVLVTRTAEQAGSFVELLRKMGAEPVPFPMIKITAPAKWAPVDRAVKGLKNYDWVIFTSVNGVRAFFERLYKTGRDVRELKGVKVCAIGPATAKTVEEWKISVDLLPKKFVAEEIIKTLGSRRIKDKKFLLPRALKAREILPQEIRRLGGRIDVVPVYRTVLPRKGAVEIKRRLKRGDIDAVTFTSSSTVRNFSTIMGRKELPQLLEKTHVACIGPITAKTARDLGLDVDIMPKDYTVPALAEAIEGFYGND